jgi:hypothetical protein
MPAADQPRPEPAADRDVILLQILRALERLERTLDEFAGAHLNARFPYGTPRDRWARRQ